MDLDNLPYPALRLIILSMGSLEWPFLRMVSRRWREAVDLEIRDAQPLHLPENFTKRFQNLKALDLTYLNRRPEASDMYNILLKLPGLNSLCIAPDVFSFLEDPEISQNQAAQVALKQQVTKLVLKGFHLSHEAPKIQGWPSLQVLCDRRACMDSVSLRLTLQLQLSEVSLTSLEAHASILNNNLSQLLEQTRLTRLVLESPKLLPSEQLAKLTTLQSLELSSMPGPVTGGLAFINALIRLTHLSVSDSSINASDLCVASALTNLQSLVCNACWITSPFGIRKIAKTFPRLVHLDLSRCREFKFHPAMEEFQHLTSLECQFCSSTKTLEPLKSLTNLRKLDASFSFQASFEGNSELQGLTALTSLNLTSKFGNISDNDMTAICALPNLQSLAITNAAITRAGAKQLSELTKLTSLNIIRCSNLTEDCLEILKGLPLAYLFCDFSPRRVASIDGALCLAVLRTWRGSRVDHEQWQI